MIHELAVIADGARIAPDADVGPFCTIGPDVEIGAGAKLVSHVVVDGHTVLGARVQVFPFATIGLAPQDLKYAGEPTRVEVGEDSIIREGVQVHRGTDGGGGVTRVGRGTLLMGYCHVAHDCDIGNSVIMANGAALAGHVHVADHAILGGLVGIHQFVRIGAHSMVGAGSMIGKDIVPFVHVAGNRDAKLHGINHVGLRRRGFDEERIRALKRAYRILFRGERRFGQAKEEVRADETLAASPDVAQLMEFLESGSDRGFVM